MEFLNSKYEIPACGRQAKQARMIKIQMTQSLQIVIANEVKQSHEIATSSCYCKTPRNDHFIILDFGFV
jgi:hypothetical protein